MCRSCVIIMVRLIDPSTTADAMVVFFFFFLAVDQQRDGKREVPVPVPGRIAKTISPLARATTLQGIQRQPRHSDKREESVLQCPLL
jgi:hypothetical protein